MELFEAIRERYSYRGAFDRKPLPEDDLIKIVQAGLDAPSGKNLQTTGFVIVNDPGRLEQIKALFSNSPFINTAPALIAVFFDAEPLPAPEFSFRFEIEDAAAATQNMLLAITALGYASVWLDGILRSGQRAEKISGIVGLPEGKKVRILLPVGIPTDLYPRREKKSFQERVRFNTWQE